VENRRDETWIEIVERPLDANGQPRDTTRAPGVFWRARRVFWIPPSSPEAAADVAGTLDGNSTRTIGEHRTPMAVVRVDRSTSGRCRSGRSIPNTTRLLVV